MEILSHILMTEITSKHRVSFESQDHFKKCSGNFVFPIGKKDFLP